MQRGELVLERNIFIYITPLGIINNEWKKEGTTRLMLMLDVVVVVFFSAFVFFQQQPTNEERNDSLNVPRVLSFLLLYTHL